LVFSFLTIGVLLVGTSWAVCSMVVSVAGCGGNSFWDNDVEASPIENFTVCEPSQESLHVADASTVKAASSAGGFQWSPTVTRSF